jgi:gliding motility-associated-like protein
MGGDRTWTHVDGGTSRFDKTGIVYHAVCAGCNTDGEGPKSDFPTTPDAWSNLNRSLNCNNAAFKFDLSSLRANVVTNSVKFDSPGLTFVCIPDTMRFQSKGIGGEIFEWDLGDGTFLQNFDSSSVLHAYASEGTYLVKLRAIDHGTCREIDSASVTVKVFRKNIVVQEDDDLCEGSSYTLRASGGTQYQWTSSDSTYNSRIPEPNVSPVDTTTYFVFISDANGCTKKDTVTLNVIPKIVPLYSVERERACFGRPSLLITNQTDSLWATDRIFFQLGDGTVSDGEFVNHRYERDGLYQITLVSERHGCTYQQTQNVPVFTLKMPNVITPNGDGINDPFFVQYGEEGTSPGAYGFKTSLIVYNRWGTVVFKSSEYENSWRGEGLSPGLYFYEVKVEDHAVCKNWIQIIR